MKEIVRKNPFLKYSFFVTFGFLCLSVGYTLGKWIIEVSL